MVKLELFVSKTCPHCPKVKLAVERALKHFPQVEFQKYRMNTPEGKAKAIEYHLLGVPAIFVDGELIRGDVSEQELAHYLDKLVNPKPSILQRLFGKK